MTQKVGEVCGGLPLQGFFRGSADVADSGDNASPLFCNLLVGCTLRSQRKLTLTAAREKHVRVGINKPGKHYLAFRIQLRIVIRQSAIEILHPANPRDLPPRAQNPSVLDDPEVAHRRAHLHPASAGRNGDELRNVLDKNIQGFQEKWCQCADVPELDRLDNSEKSKKDTKTRGEAQARNGLAMVVISVVILHTLLEASRVARRVKRVLPSVF